MGRLEGRVAILTGAGRPRGLGCAIATRLVQEGCRVVVSDAFAGQELRDVVAGLGGGRVAVARVCDVRDEVAVADLVAAALEAWDRLDIAVAGAGVGHVIGPVTELDVRDWDAVLDVNLRGAFLLAKHAARALRAQGAGGRIINIASIGGRRGSALLASYNASKHGLIGLTRSLAAELGPDGITVNAVCPNHVTTDMGARQNEIIAARRGMTVEAYLDDMRARIPLRRLATGADVAAACTYLASDDGAFLNGVALDVNGGEHMG